MSKKGRVPLIPAVPAVPAVPGCFILTQRRGGAEGGIGGDGFLGGVDNFQFLELLCGWVSGVLLQITYEFKFYRREEVVGGESQ